MPIAKSKRGIKENIMIEKNLANDFLENSQNPSRDSINANEAVFNVLNMNMKAGDAIKAANASLFGFMSKSFSNNIRRMKLIAPNMKGIIGIIYSGINERTYLAPIGYAANLPPKLRLSFIPKSTALLMREYDSVPGSIESGLLNTITSKSAITRARASPKLADKLVNFCFFPFKFRLKAFFTDIF